MCVADPFDQWGELAQGGALPNDGIGDFAHAIIDVDHGAPASRE